MQETQASLAGKGRTRLRTLTGYTLLQHVVPTGLQKSFVSLAWSAWFSPSTWLQTPETAKSNGQTPEVTKSPSGI